MAFHLYKKYCHILISRDKTSRGSRPGARHPVSLLKFLQAKHHCVGTVLNSHYSLTELLEICKIRNVFFISFCPYVLLWFLTVSVFSLKMVQCDSHVSISFSCFLTRSFLQKNTQERLQRPLFVLPGHSEL